MGRGLLPLLPEGIKWTVIWGRGSLGACLQLRWLRVQLLRALGGCGACWGPPSAHSSVSFCFQGLKSPMSHQARLGTEAPQALLGASGYEPKATPFGCCGMPEATSGSPAGGGLSSCVPSAGSSRCLGLVWPHPRPLSAPAHFIFGFLKNDVDTKVPRPGHCEPLVGVSSTTGALGSPTPTFLPARQSA